MSPPSETPDALRRKRVRFRAWHRGFKEVDLILGPFADDHLAGLSERELDEFENLLGVPDQDFYDWICGRALPPPQYQTAIYNRVRDFALSRPSP